MTTPTEQSEARKLADDHRESEHQQVLRCVGHRQAAMTAKQISFEVDGQSLGCARWVRNAIDRLVRAGRLERAGRDYSGQHLYVEGRRSR